MSIYCTCPCLADTNMNSSEHVVFNEDDVVLQNGYVECVSATLSGNSKQLDISLYVISPKVEGEGAFHAVYRYKISKKADSKESSNISIRLSDSKLYIEAGQFLAIGFDQSMISPQDIVADQDNYKLFLDKIDPYGKIKEPMPLNTSNSKIYFSFRLVPTQGKSLLNPKSTYIYTCISCCFQILLAIFSFGLYLVIATIRASFYVHTVR
jgi:hypothetical protein